MIFAPVKRRHWWHAAVVVVVIAAMAFALRAIGLSLAVFDPLGQAIDQYHFSDGLFYARNKMTRLPQANPDVVIMDISGCHSRAEIAAVLDKVGSAQPAAVGLDIIFPDASSVLPEENDSLIRAISRLPNLVLACNESQGTEEHSFFSENFVEGNVAMEYDMVRSFHSGDGSFVGELLRKIGRPELMDQTERMIDFDRVHTYVYEHDNEIPSREVAGCIVLVGDKQDLRDFHRVPVSVNGNLRLSGEELLAQELYTVLCGKRFRECSFGLTMCLCILLTYLFCALVVCPLHDAKKPFNSLVCSLGLFILVILLTFLEYWVFFSLNIYWSPVWLFVGTGLAGLSAEVFYWIINRVKR